MQFSSHEELGLNKKLYIIRRPFSFFSRLIAATAAALLCFDYVLSDKNEGKKNDADV